MARARLLKPGFFANEELCMLPPFGRLLFAGLWTIADREGRLVDSPRWIKAQIFPFDNVPAEKLLTDLDKAGFIQRYEGSDGKRYVQVTNFEKHQHVHIKEGPSTIPAPDKHGASTVQSPVISSASPAEAKAVTKAEAEAEAVERAREELPWAFKTDPPWPDDETPQETYVGRFVREHQLSHSGSPPSPVQQAAAKALERDFGPAACIQIAEDYGWQKGPNYLREALNDPSRGKRTNGANGQSRRTSSANGLSPSDKAKRQLARR